MMMQAEAMECSAFVFPNTNIDDVLIVVEFMDSQNKHLMGCCASSFRCRLPEGEQSRLRGVEAETRG